MADQNSRPPLRLVVSFTTSPRRLEACGEMVRILRAGHLGLAASSVELRLLMPKLFGRTREPFGGELPSWWAAESARPGMPMAFVLVDDVGPATKILGNLQAEAESGLAPAGAYISVDDDQAYPPGALDQLLQHHGRLPDCVLCYSGVRITRQLDGTITQRNTGPILGAHEVPRMRPSLAAAVDFPEGFNGVLYPRAALLDLAPLRDAFLQPGAVPGFVLRGDDYVLGNALAALGVTRLAVAQVPLPPGRTTGELAYGFGEDALHKVDGSDPAERYRPIIEWAASAPEVPTPLLRDALWRDPYEAADLRAVPAGWDARTLPESRPGAAWAILAGLLALAALLFFALRRYGKAATAAAASRPRAVAALAVLIPLAVGLAVLLAPRTKNTSPTRRRGTGREAGRRPLRRDSRAPLCHLRRAAEGDGAAVPLCWPSAEFADLAYEPGEYEFADADDPLGRDKPAGACDGYPNALVPAGPFLELADGRCAVVGPGGRVRIVAPAGLRAHRSGGMKERALEPEADGRPTSGAIPKELAPKGQWADRTPSEAKGSAAGALLPVVGASRYRPPHLARDLTWRRGPAMEPEPSSPPPAIILAVPAASAEPLLEALLGRGPAGMPGEGPRAPSGSIVRVVAAAPEGGAAWAAMQNSWAQPGVRLERIAAAADAGLPLAALSDADEDDALVVALPEVDGPAEAEAAVEHLGLMLARARQLPRCVVAAEAWLMVRDDEGRLALHPCPAGCVASVVDPSAGPVVYRAGMLRRAGAIRKGFAAEAPAASFAFGSEATPSAAALLLSEALAEAGTPIVKLPDPYVKANAAAGAITRRGPRRVRGVPPGLAARALRPVQSIA